MCAKQILISHQKNLPSKWETKLKKWDVFESKLGKQNASKKGNSVILQLRNTLDAAEGNVNL